MEQNPQPEQLYTTQVSSYEDLQDRMSKSKDMVKKLNDRLKTDIGAMTKAK